MEKNIIIINPQSFVDVITNSSSELFICNTEKSISMIKSILKSILDKHNKMKGENHSYEDCFGEISIVDGKNPTGEYFIDDMPDTKEDALVERRIKILEYMFEEMMMSKDRMSWNKLNWSEQERLTTEWVDIQMAGYQREETLSSVMDSKSEMPDWWHTGDYRPTTGRRFYEPLKWKGQYIGRIIIPSSTDNSIPYEIFDEIESIFNAERHHLG